MSVKQMSVFLENRPGTLETLLDKLADEKINLFALSIADTEKYGVARMILSDSDKAVKVLAEEGYTAKASPVVAVEIADVAGSLSTLLRVLSKAKINLEYLYSMKREEDEKVYMILRVEDNEKTEKILKENGYKVLE